MKSLLKIIPWRLFLASVAVALFYYVQINVFLFYSSFVCVQQSTRSVALIDHLSHCSVSFYMLIRARIVNTTKLRPSFCVRQCPHSLRKQAYFRSSLLSTHAKKRIRTFWNRIFLIRRVGVDGARLRVVPHFSSGIVERAVRERALKSPHARKGDTMGP